MLGRAWAQTVGRHVYVQAESIWGKIGSMWACRSKNHPLARGLCGICIDKRKKKVLQLIVACAAPNRPQLISHPTSSACVCDFFHQVVVQDPF